jgi:hypothetical protein
LFNEIQAWDFISSFVSSLISSFFYGCNKVHSVLFAACIMAFYGFFCSNAKLERMPNGSYWQ